jgi:poly(A) polymerase
MVDPTIVPRAEHTISRRQIDPDALKVLYRLHHADHIAYLVGGSVRDLFVGRIPKDFDIGTSAHPHQVKRLFRNCWVIGRRFRLAHIKFGNKVVEVATFRRTVPAIDDMSGDGTIAPDAVEIAGDLHLAHPVPVAVADEAPVAAERWVVTESGLAPFDRAAAAEASRARARGTQVRADRTDLLIHRDNTFGTPEEDAFRRDFTVNALFYDIATRSIIDYTGGLDDLRERVIRSIGDPNQRFLEDPVRMIRAVALASRLGFTIDPPAIEAIRRHRQELARSAPARLFEEYLKILRAGHAEEAFRQLHALGLLDAVTPELDEAAGESLWHALARLDAYRQRYEVTPDTLTNPVLLGTLLVAVGFSGRRRREWEQGEEEPRIALGVLPLPRRDVDQLRQVLSMQRRLRDLESPVRSHKALMHRAAFQDALTWLEIHGDADQAVWHWRALTAETSETREQPARRPRRRRPPRRPGIGPAVES